MFLQQAYVIFLTKPIDVAHHVKIKLRGESREMFVKQVCSLAFILPVLTSCLSGADLLNLSRGVSENSDADPEEPEEEPESLAFLDSTDRIAFVGNSFTGNFGGLNNSIKAAIASRYPAYSSLTAIPAHSSNSWYYGQGLDGMTAAIPLIEAASEGAGASPNFNTPFDVCVFTSGNLSDMRAFANAFFADNSSGAQVCDHVVIYMTWESTNPSSLTAIQYTNAIGPIVARARTMEAEYPDIVVVPAGYIFYDFSVNPPTSIGVPPREDYIYGQNNIHQNGLGTVINAYTFFAVMMDESPVGLDYNVNTAPNPDIAMFNSGSNVFSLGMEGASLYTQGSITFTPTVRTEIQARIWQNIQKWRAGTTEFD